MLLFFLSYSVKVLVNLEADEQKMRPVGDFLWLVVMLQVSFNALTLVVK